MTAGLRRHGAGYDTLMRRLRLVVGGPTVVSRTPPGPAVPRLAVALFLVSMLVGCVPYAVGTTAETVPARRVAPSAVVQIASANRDLDRGERPSGAVASIGNEARLGLDAHSDIGVRILSLGSVVATYKRRLSGTGQAGTALLVGAGVVGADQLHVEATFVASLARRGSVVPYGGVRVQDLTPFAGDALATDPAVGAFAGARFGWPDLSLSPEIGIFYSPSPLAGDDAIIVVPSVTINGDRLMRALGL